MRRTVSKLQDTFVLQLRIRLSDCGVTYDDLLRQCPDAGKLVPGTQDSGVHGVPDLLHELEIEGLAGLRVKFEDHAELYQC